MPGEAAGVVGAAVVGARVKEGEDRQRAVPDRESDVVAARHEGQVDGQLTRGRGQRGRLPAAAESGEHASGEDQAAGEADADEDGLSTARRGPPP